MSYEHPIVVVHWQDAYWSVDECERGASPIPLIDVGFLVKESDEGVLLAAEYKVEDPNDNRHFVFIPWANITKIEEVQWVSK